MADTSPNPNPLERHYFLLRRLHSLAGIVPIGVYLFPHLTTNSSVVWGRYLNQPDVPAEALGSASMAAHAGVETFQHEVNFIHSLPALVLIEIFAIWLPLAFHAVLGVYYAATGSSNLTRYAYQGNWRYTMQRLTGYLGFLFILYHIATLRWGWDWLPLASTFDPQHAASTTALALRAGSEQFTAGGVLVSGFYLICTLALVYHFANGLWTAAITWGVTVSEQAQKRWGFVCAGVGVALAAAGVASVLGFGMLDVDAARAIENAMQQSPVHTPGPTP